MRAEDQTQILAAVDERVAAHRIAAANGGKASIEEVLSESLYHERRRLKEDKRSRTRAADLAFWEEVQQKLTRSHADEWESLLHRAIQRYAGEIAGNFDPRVYQVVTRIMPPALGLLLNAVSPARLLRRFHDLPSIDDAIIIQGEVEQLKRLHELGTVILVPTHVSNLDSIVIGYALYRLSLPPFIYGAGLNLFSNPLIGYFMHNLGAYTVDRKKTDPLYKDALKEYATLTLEFGYHNLFFPGGTRSRSGAIEKKLKMGLLGTGVSAYVNNLKKKSPSPKIYIVPATLSYQLVLEAETLIDDFLKEVGKSRYIIDDDEFAKPKRVLDFMSQLLGLDSRIEVTVSRALDPFGNDVDNEGNSLDPCGRIIDTARYVMHRQDPVHAPDRDAEYTREVGERIIDAFARDNVIASTNVLARAMFTLLRKQHPKLDLLRLLRIGGGGDDTFDLSQVHDETARLLFELRALEKRGAIRLAPGLRTDGVEDVVADGLRHFAIYHTRPAVTRRGDRMHPTDRNLLLYYQNRLEGYGLSRMEARPATLSHDHRAIAAA
jgi:glycerol-3-phosphate O-acyltransferase